MAYEWESSGPPLLDLASPMMQGEQIGAQAALRREQAVKDAADIQNMRANLGLQQQEQTFRENQWNAMGGQRQAQLDLMNAQITGQTQEQQLNAFHFNNQVADQGALGEGQKTLDQMAANGNFTGISNAPAPQGTDANGNPVPLTADGVAAWEKLKGTYLQGTAATQQLAQNNQNAGVALQYNQLFGKTLTNPDGTPDVPGMNAALTQREVTMEKNKAENSATAVAAQVRAQASMYGADSRNQQRNYVANKQAAQKYLSNLQTVYGNLQKSGNMTPDQDTYYKGEIQKAQNGYAPMDGNGAAPAASAPAATAPVDNSGAVNSLLKNSFGG